MAISLNRKYSFSTYLHPEHDFLYSLAHFWGDQVVSYDFKNTKTTEGEKLMDYLNTPEARRLLEASSVRYIPVFIKDDPSLQSIRRDLGEDRPFFENEMANASYIRKTSIGMDNIILYEILDYKPHIYLTYERETVKKDVEYRKTDFKMIGPSKYEIYIRNFKDPFFINFTELYEQSWGIHVGKFGWVDAFLSKDYFLPENLHSQNALNFNQFFIDPKTICSINRCRANPDGSYDIKATLYYKPQAYFYFGLITALIGAGSVLIITVYSIRKRNE